MVKFIRNQSGRGGHLYGERISLAYRGFTIRPFVRRKPINIGSTRLYCLGPIAVFIKAKTKRNTK